MRNFNTTVETQKNPSDVAARFSPWNEKTFRYAANKTNYYDYHHIFSHWKFQSRQQQESLLVSSTFLLIIIHKSYRHRRIKGSQRQSEKQRRMRKENKAQERRKNTEI